MLGLNSLNKFRHVAEDSQATIPRRWIFISPKASTKSKSNCVITTPLPPERITGTRSVKLPGATITPPGCMEERDGSFRMASASSKIGG